MAETMKYNSTAYEEDLCLQEIRENAPTMVGEWLDNRQGDMILDGNTEWVMDAKATGDNPIVWRKIREVSGSHKVIITFRKFTGDRMNLTFISENSTGTYQRTFWFTNEHHIKNVQGFLESSGFDTILKNGFY